MAKRKCHPAEQLFSRHFDVGAADECWNWRGGTRGCGHGKFGSGGVYLSAHRFAYEKVHGPIPDGLVVRHMCDNPACVNPAHLTIGTRSDNAKDAVRAGTWSSGGTRKSEAMIAAIEAALQPGAIPFTVAREYGVHAPSLYRHLRRERARRATQEASL